MISIVLGAKGEKMKNEYGVRLHQVHARGVEEGILTGQLLMLIALENIADEYIPEERIDEFLRHAESEIASVWKGTKEMMRTEQRLNGKNSVDSNAVIIGEYLTGHVDRIRAKRHMDETWVKKEGMFVCPYCGEAYHDRTSFCPNCGKGLGNDDSN